MENPKSRAWKVVKSEYLARKPWFTVRHERIELPDGRSIPDYYVFEYPDWVNVIAITKEGKFVFIDQYRHGLGETNYEIPAGVAEPDDASMLAAAQRELAEETGYGGGGYPRASVHGRRGARTAHGRRHPAGADGRAAMALRRGVRVVATLRRICCRAAAKSALRPHRTRRRCRAPARGS